jgi:cell division protein FtsB
MTEPPQRRPLPRQPHPTRLTGRAALLAVVICAIALSLAYPVREYIAQRRQIDQLLATQQSVSAQVQSLQAQQRRFADPVYIEQQARDQLHMCFPAEKCYVIIGDSKPPGTTPQQARAAAPWYAKLWQSVKKADQAPVR